MNSRERIGAVLTGTKPDRPGFAMTLSLYGARLTDCPLPQYFSDPTRYVEGQVAVHETISPDVLFGPFAFAHLGAAFGGEIKEFADQAPNIRRPACSTAKELEEKEAPDPETDEYLLYHTRAVRELADSFGKDTPVAAILPFPIDLPALILGMDGWMETVLFDPEGTEAVIEYIMPFFVDFANRMYAEGADFIVTPCAFSSPAVVTRAIATSFARPVLEETIRQLKGPVVLHHGGAPVLANLDLMTGIPSVIGYVMDAKDDLTKARVIVGPDPVLFSGPDNLSVPALSSGEVKNWCLKVLLDRREDPHFLLCNSGPDIPLHTPLENILAFQEAALSFAGTA